MDPALIRLGGSGLEVLGAFLLAVEAIKLHNLRFMREKVLKVAALKVNPVIRFVDAKSDEGKKQAGETWINILIAFFMLLGVSITYGVLRFLGLGLRDAWAAFSGFVPGSLWVDVVAALPAGFVALLVASVVGSGAYTLVVLLLDAMIAVLDFIERHTATGVVGIVGFLFFLTGAAVKAYLDWKGA